MNNNKTQDEVLELIGKFPIEPMFNKVIITLNTEEEDGVIMSDGMLSDVQYIVAVGPVAKQYISAGQKVLIDLEKLEVRESTPTDSTKYVTTIKIDPLKIDGEMYAILDDRFIKAKDNR